MQLRASSKGFLKKHKFIIFCQSGGKSQKIESDSLLGYNIKFESMSEVITNIFSDIDEIIVGVEIQLDS